MTGVSTSCGACKFLRRKCTNECVFAPYFSYDEAVGHFGAVHKVFGASNVSRLLLHLPEQCRGEAAMTISFEAIARMRDPVYGCVAYIYALQQEVANLQEEIEVLGNHMVNNLTIGVATSDQCVTSQATNNHNNNIMMNDLLLPLSSQEIEHQMMNLPEYWNSISSSSITSDYQVVEPTTVLNTHAENNNNNNGSCSSQMMMSNHMNMIYLPESSCLCQGQNLSGITIDSTGGGPHDYCLVEGLLNQETFDISSLIAWSPDIRS